MLKKAFVQSWCAPVIILFHCAAALTLRVRKVLTYLFPSMPMQRHVPQPLVHLFFALSDSGATSESARWLADSENRSDLIGGAGNVKLDDKDAMLAGVLLDLSMTASLSSSLDVGQKVLSNMGRITPLHKKTCGASRLYGA